MKPISKIERFKRRKVGNVVQKVVVEQPKATAKKTTRKKTTNKSTPMGKKK